MGSLWGFGQEAGVGSMQKGFINLKAYVYLELESRRGMQCLHLLTKVAIGIGYFD
jgi:hypothetical protein